MRPDISRRARRWLLLCALALSLVGMHHVPLSPHCAPHVTMPAHATADPASPMSPADMATPSGDSSTGHDLLHLCLAVLWAAGGLLLLAWLTVAVGGPSFVDVLLWVRRRWRPPGTAGRSLLTSLCVMRT